MNTVDHSSTLDVPLDVARIKADLPIFDERVNIVGPTDPDIRAGVVSFTVDGIHPHDLATLLDG